MKLSVGIVGLPNVGKSTLFNALLKKQTAHVANYPFATIEPNVGVVEVPDERLPVLAKIVKTEKIVPAIVEFYDIAGLVKGASKGEGLGNKFLSHIREVAAIVHVVRLFEDKEIINTQNAINPESDIKIIEEELMLADLQTLEKQSHSAQKSSVRDKKEQETFELINKIQEKLDQGIPVRNQNLAGEQLELIKHLNLLTAKPLIFCFNCSLEQLEEKEKTIKTVEQILNQFDKLTVKHVLSGVERQVQNDSSSYLLFNPLFEESLDELIKKAYKTLGLISFLTAGEKEVRAWTITQGIAAPQAAGAIHTDFTKHFIKVDAVSYENFVKAGGWNGAREQGLVQTGGRDYVMKEGDVVDFKVGI